MHTIKVPPRVKKGEAIRADTLNKIMDVLESLDISGGPGIEISKSTRGITIKLRGGLPKSVGGGGGGVAAPTGPFPFDVEFSDTDETNTTAFIRFGTVNGLLPTGILDDTVLTISTVYYLVLHFESTDGTITSASISFLTTPPDAIPTQMGLPPTTADLLLGVVFGGVWYRVIGNGSLSATGSEVFRVSKASPDPGTLPYDIYYTWAFSIA